MELFSFIKKLKLCLKSEIFLNSKYFIITLNDIKSELN